MKYYSGMYFNFKYLPMYNGVGILPPLRLAATPDNLNFSSCSNSMEFDNVSIVKHSTDSSFLRPNLTAEFAWSHPISEIYKFKETILN